MEEDGRQQAGATAAKKKKKKKEGGRQARYEVRVISTTDTEMAMATRHAAR